MEWRNIPLADMPKVAKEIFAMLQPGDVVVLSGDLGTGKTTFVQAIGALLGVKESIESPTYILMQDFKTSDIKFKTLRHFDLYRIEDEGELHRRHLDEYWKAVDGISFVEWGERFDIPKTARIMIQIGDFETRDIVVERVE